MFSDNTPNFMAFSDPPEMEKKIPIVQKKKKNTVMGTNQPPCDVTKGCDTSFTSFRLMSTPQPAV